MEEIVAEAQAAADAVWASVPEPASLVPDVVLRRYLVAAYVAATRVLLAEMCPSCAHRAAYEIASGETRVGSDNPLASLN